MENVVDILKTNAEEIFAPHDNVMIAYLYGSYAKEKQTPMSDLDIGLVLKTSLPFEQASSVRRSIRRSIERLVSVPEIEVTIFNTLGIEFRGHVLSHSICLFTRDESFLQQYEELTRTEYQRELPRIEKETREFFRRLKAKMSQPQ
jgi:predicted nucleotidyltransferase